MCYRPDIYINGQLKIKNGWVKEFTLLIKNNEHNEQYQESNLSLGYYIFTIFTYCLKQLITNLHFF